MTYKSESELKKMREAAEIADSDAEGDRSGQAGYNDKKIR